MANTTVRDLNQYTGGTPSDVLLIDNLTTNKTEKISRQDLYDGYSANTTNSSVFVMPKDISGNFTIPTNSNSFVFGEDIQITGTVVVGSGTTFYVFDPANYQLANNKFNNVPEYLDNADAINNGLVVGKIYRTGDLLKIVH